MSNKEKLEKWFENEKTKGLVDVKLCPGEIAKSSIETLSSAVLGFVNARESGNRTKLTKI